MTESAEKNFPAYSHLPYHINEDALITLPSGEIVAISNQWGIVNIELLIEFVRQNGFVVEKAEQ